MAVRNRSDPSVLGRLNEEGRQALKSIFEDLKRKLQELQKLLHDYLPSEDASSSTKFLKAMGSLAIEKRIDKIMKLIFERYMPVLTLSTIDNQTLQTEVIKKAMETTSMESRVNLRQKPHFLVNVQRDDDFVGRQDIMSRLNALVNPVERHNRVALVALGGMGSVCIRKSISFAYLPIAKLGLHLSALLSIRNLRMSQSTGCTLRMRAEYSKPTMRWRGRSILLLTPTLQPTTCKPCKKIR